jgi:hypothetical protein
VRVGLGQGVSRDWQQAVTQALNPPAVKPFFDPQDRHTWSELTRQGKSAFGLLFSPGNTRAADSRSFEILAELKRLSQGRLPIIGGAAADDWRLQTNYVLWGRQAYPDSLLVAVFETQLQFGIAMAHGFQPTSRKATVTRARTHEVLELDGQPAAQVYAQLLGRSREDLAGKHLTLTTKRPAGILDPYGQYSLNVASFFTPEQGVRFAQPVVEGTVLTIMESDHRSLLAAGADSVRKALLRGSILDPALILTFPCAIRNRLLAGEVQEEIAGMGRMLPATPIVGFYSFGEQGLSDDGVNRHNNAVIATLVLDRELSHGARVAMENAALQQELGQRQAALEIVNEQLRHEIAERRQAEEAKRLLNPDPVLELSLNGAITFANEGAHLACQRLGTNIIEDLLPQDLPEILRTIKTGGEKEFYREVRVKDAVFGENISYSPQLQVNAFMPITSPNAKLSRKI